MSHIVPSGEGPACPLRPSNADPKDGHVAQTKETNVQ